MSTAHPPASEHYGVEPTVSDRSPEAVARDFFDAFDRKDVEKMLSLVSDDIVEDVPGVGIIEGTEQERSFLSSLFSSFPDMATDVTRVTTSGGVVAVEWSRRGTFTGEPWQGLPANGRAFDTRGAAFVEVSGSRVTRVTIYSDQATLARDLGVLPAEGSGAERLALAVFRARVKSRRILGALLPSRKGRN